MTQNITVSIVLYKTPISDIKKVINSLSLYQGKLHLFFIDNSPTDSLKKDCIGKISFEYVHLPENPGFGAGHNVAIKKAMQAGSKFHLVLNADVHFNTDVISSMLNYCEENPNVGLMMPKVLNPDGSLQRLCKLVPTPADLFLRRFMNEKVKKRNNQRFELHDSGYNKVMFVPYLSGCFMLLRLNALQRIGLFDERFFMYPDDIDLTRRMAEHYDTLFFPEVSVTHEYGAASHRSIKMLAIHAFNIIKYFNKWGWINDPVRDALNKKTLHQFVDS